MSKTSGDSTADRKALGAVLSTVLHLYVTYLALPMWFLAPAYATSLISLIGGQTWLQSGAPLALAFYCRFLPFLASNGVLEAFVQTVADPKTMSSYSTSLVFFWLAFAATAWTFMGGVFDWGATGMICAALINVALRLSWGAKHAGRYFAGAAGGFSLTSLFSNDPAVWIAWTVAWFTSSQAVPRITAVDMAQRRTDVACLGVGGLLGLCCILFTAYRERQFWRSLRELRQK